MCKLDGKQNIRMATKIKIWTPKQLERLAEIGYWVNCYPDSAFYLVECTMNGKAKYIRNDWGVGRDWFTLLWSCAATKNRVKDRLFNQTWTYFKTYDEMMAATPDLKKFIKTKAPNDF